MTIVKLVSYIKVSTFFKDDDDDFGEEVFTGRVKAATLPMGGPASRRVKKKVEGGPIAQGCNPFVFSFVSIWSSRSNNIYIWISSIFSSISNTFKQTSLNQARASNIFCKMVILISCFSLRWVAHHLRPPADPGLPGADPGHAPPLPHLLYQSGPGTDIRTVSVNWKHPSHIPLYWSYNWFLKLKLVNPSQ